MPTTRLNSHLKKNEIETLKVLLSAESERLEQSFKEKSQEKDELSNSNKDEVDSANDQILMSQNQRFTKRDFFYYKKVKKALEMIEDEEYGICQECGDSISYLRLKARPTSEMCINCKEESEREEKQNFYKRQSKSLTSELSFTSV